MEKEKVILVSNGEYIVAKQLAESIEMNLRIKTVASSSLETTMAQLEQRNVSLLISDIILPSNAGGRLAYASPKPGTNIYANPNGLKIKEEAHKRGTNVVFYATGITVKTVEMLISEGKLTGQEVISGPKFPSEILEKITQAMMLETR